MATKIYNLLTNVTKLLNLKKNQNKNNLKNGFFDAS